MKCLICLLMVLLTLTGCGGDGQETTTTLTAPSALPTEPPGSYDPDSTVEMYTEGAVRAYPQSIPNIYAIAAAGSDLLVFSGVGNTCLTRLTGENLFRIAERQLDIPLHPADISLQISADRLVYFDDNTGEMVWLDEAFREFYRVQLPETITGSPVVSANRQQIYFCTPEGLRVLDVESGISRLLKEMTFPGQWVYGLLMEDTVIQCLTSDGEGNEKYLYLDAQIGGMLAETETGSEVFSHADWFYSYDGNGTVLFGRENERPSVLNVQGKTTVLPENHAVLTCWEGDDFRRCEYYDLTSGRLAHAQTLPGHIAPRYFAVDAEQARVFFISHSEAESDTIYRWDVTASPSGDDRVHTVPWYTVDDPDVEGLANCQAKADALSQQYGLDIRIFEDAVAVRPDGCHFGVAHQVPEIESALQTLESQFAVFPDGFFAQTMETLEEGSLHLCLVASVNDGGCSENGATFWAENDAYIALNLGETLQEEFFHQLLHAMETRIMSTSIAYYRWDELNPAGFAYGVNQEGGRYLEDDTTRCFIDTQSMVSPMEDRAQIFRFACMEGNESYFISATMQKKLRTLCQGIRDAYGLEKTDESFLWEQYLESPL